MTYVRLMYDLPIIKTSHTTTHKPKRKQEKKRQKKKKKESHYFKGARIGMQGFWKINTTSFILKNQTTEKKSVEIYFTKYILTLQTKTKHTYLCFLFYFLGMCVILQLLRN